MQHLKQTCLNNILEKNKERRGVNKRQPLLFQRATHTAHGRIIFPIAENSVPANKPTRTIKPIQHTPKWIKINPFAVFKKSLCRLV
jgi:hypothetical protein